MRLLATKPNVIAPNSDFPFGRLRDRAGAVHGTPVTEQVYGDIHQFFEKLMNIAAVIANGLPESAYSGFQLITALTTVITNIASALVATETSARIAAVSAEATARASADSTEATTRASADTTETSARIAADAAEATARIALATSLGIIYRGQANTNSGGTATTILAIPRTADKTSRFDIKMVSRYVSGGDPVGSGSTSYIVCRVTDVGGVGTLISANIVVDLQRSVANAPDLTAVISGGNLLIQSQAGSGLVYSVTIKAEVTEGA